MTGAVKVLDHTSMRHIAKTYGRTYKYADWYAICGYQTFTTGSQSFSSYDENDPDVCVECKELLGAAYLAGRFAFDSPLAVFEEFCLEDV